MAKRKQQAPLRNVFVSGCLVTSVGFGQSPGGGVTVWCYGHCWHKSDTCSVHRKPDRECFVSRARREAMSALMEMIDSELKELERDDG